MRVAPGGVPGAGRQSGGNMSARTNRATVRRAGPPEARRTPSARSRPSPRRPLPPPHNPQQRQPAPSQRSRNRDHQCRDRRHPGRRRLPQGPDHHRRPPQRLCVIGDTPRTRRHRHVQARIHPQPAHPRCRTSHAPPDLQPARDQRRQPYLTWPQPWTDFVHIRIHEARSGRQPVHPLRDHLQHTAVAERRQPPHHHRRQKQTRAESRALPAGQRPRARLLRHHRRPRPPRPGRTVHQRKRQPHRPTKTAGRTTSSCGSGPTSDPPSPRRAATRMLPCSLWVAWSVLSRVK